MLQLKIYQSGFRGSSLVAKVFALRALGFYMGTGNSDGPTSHVTPCLWPEKGVEDEPKPWDHAPIWESWNKLLASGFGLAQL